MMDIIKKNVVSISCGAAALLAIVAVLVWPMPGWFAELQGKLATSESDYDTIHKLNVGRFNKPNVDPLKTETEPLGQFPNEPTIKAGVAIVEKMREQIAGMERVAKAMNKHEPLVRLALPVKQSPQAYNDFKIRYYEMLNDFRLAMNGIAAPTQDEINAKAEQLRVEDYEKRIQKAGGQDVNRVEVEAMYNARVATLPDEMRRERAKQYTVFLGDHKTLDACQGIMPLRDTSDLPTDPMQIWATQLTLWIQEDVVRAIVETNQKIPNATVETAIVKRLVTWDIPKRYVAKKGDVVMMEGQQSQPGGRTGGFGPSAFQLQAMRGGGGAVDPSATVEEEATPATKVFASSPTGRVCNTMYDVMHFTVVVDADAKKFREFMANLTKGQFITILSVDLIGVDRDREQGRGFMYGPNPVIRLRLTCEALFFRAWTKPLMPMSVQKLLGIPQAEAPTATAER